MINFTAILLSSLYFSQGVIFSLSGNFQTILIEKGLKISDLFYFSFATYPFSFKILLAPFLDSYYFSKLGKYKTYIVLMNLLMSIMFLYLSKNVDFLIERNEINFLGIFFFIVVLFMAFQDIAVDSWAIKLFQSDENSSKAGICQSVGMMLGFLFSNTVFLQLHSLEFCNKHIYKVNHFLNLFKISPN